jgi:lipopolysaccharide/colanic/teichoic acid biosynthesis glycosyltransferase
MNAKSPSSQTSLAREFREIKMTPQTDELPLLTLQADSSAYVEAVRSSVKRAMDFSGALVGLLVLMPVMLMVAVLIRFDSPGPILFRQLRRGYRGRLFWVVKFRTMRVGAEAQLKDLEDKNEAGGNVLFKIKNDPRVTPLGRFLRRSSLDELPQLINILRGEMSIVGPRPLQLRDSDLLLAEDAEGYRARLQVLPGLTGPWQAGGRSDVGSDLMVKMDVEYAKNWTILGDVALILRTIVVVLKGRGAC